MHFKDIQARPGEGVMKVALDKISESGQAIPEIMHLFRFKKRATDHLVRFTDEVMRGPSPLSPGLRELIGTFVSSRNQCRFCSCAHAPAAAQLLGKQLVDEVLLDPETSRLDEAHKELFRYLSKLTQNSSSVDAADVERLKALGWSEEAIYDALTVAAVFKFYNTWNNGAGVQQMGSADFLHSGTRLVQMGYCMDFGPKAIFKVLWAGRKEVTYNDLKQLAKVAVSRFINIFKGGTRAPAAAPPSSVPVIVP